MSAWSRPYLGFALALALLGGCGSESPAGSDDTETDDDSSSADDDTTADDDEDDDTASGDDDSDNAPSGGKKDAGPGKIDAGPPKDAGGSSSEGGAKPAADAGGSTTKDGGASTPPRRDGGGTPTPPQDAGPQNGGVKGDCCPDGNCLCHGDVPNELSARRGKFKVADFSVSAGDVYYPTDAEPPFAGVAIIPGFLNVGPEMSEWGSFYASWGIVCVVTYSSPVDIPDIRALLLAGAIDDLKAENTKAGGPLNGKMSGRYGTSGYSMGGGGTTIAAQGDPSLKTSVGLAPWGGRGGRTTVPTLLMCGSLDAVAPCSMAQGVYGEIPDSTPKMGIEFPSSEHLASWFGPGDSGSGMSGGKALAFNKYYLEGDTRWKELLLGPAGLATQTTNIK